MNEHQEAQLAKMQRIVELMKEVHEDHDENGQDTTTEDKVDFQNAIRGLMEQTAEMEHADGADNLPTYRHPLETDDMAPEVVEALARDDIAKMTETADEAIRRFALRLISIGDRFPNLQQEAGPRVLAAKVFHETWKGSASVIATDENGNRVGEAGSVPETANELLRKITDARARRNGERPKDKDEDEPVYGQYL